MKLGIIGAMDVEVATLKAKMENKTETTVAGMVFCEGTLENLPAVVVQCGVGKVNAALCAQILCSNFAVTHIVNTGIAGSLDAELDIGDFVISRDAVYHDFDCHILNDAYVVGQVPGLPVRKFPADEMLCKLAYATADTLFPGHAKIGTVASGDQFICDREIKNKIIQNTGAICTEMEGAAIAQAAYLNKVPCLIIRAISDKADDSANMDYSVFEAKAVEHSVRLMAAMLEAM